MLLTFGLWANPTLDIMKNGMLSVRLLIRRIVVVLTMFMRSTSTIIRLFHAAFCQVNVAPRVAWHFSLLVLLCLGMFAAPLPLLANYSPHIASPRPPVLIVYDSWHQLPNPRFTDIQAPDSSCADALQLEQLLGHFPFSAQLVRLTEYQPGMLANYPYLFFIGNVKKAVLPARFLRDVQQYHGSLYWINYGIGQLDPHLLQKMGIAFQRLESAPGYTKVQYHGVVLEKGDPTTNIIRVTTPEHCTVIADAFAEKRSSIPYIVRSGHFWYVADSPFSYIGDSDRYFAFTDTLYDFFAVKPMVRKRAMLRIEDLNVTDDPNALRDIANRLSALHVPYALSTIPHYKNPTSPKLRNQDIPMERAPAYVSAMQYMMKHGGSVVMHGDTHQYNQGISSDDFEFWNGANEQNHVIPGDSVSLVEKKLQDGLSRLFDAQLYPIAWETPHYAASIQDYSVISRHFSTALEQRVLMNRPEYSQYFPFVIQRDIYGQQIFPENLGYVQLQLDDEKHEDIKAEEEEVDAILHNAHNLGVLRDVTVGVFIHSFVKTELVTRLAQGLLQEGYTFIDLRKENNTVQFDDMLTATGKMHGQIQLHNEYLHEFYLDSQGNIRQESCSNEKITGTVKRDMTVPSGWTYVCHGRRDRPLSWLAKTQQSIWKNLKSLPAHFTSNEETPANEPARVALLTADHLPHATACDQAGFIQAFTAMGLAPETLPAKQVTVKMLEQYNVLVVPQGSALILSPAQIAFIIGEVNRGLNILIDGDSSLARDLGIKFTSTTHMVSDVRDIKTDQELHWVPAAAPECTFPSGANALYQDRATELTLAAWFSLNRGRCLAFTTLFDQTTGLGYVRYPTLPTAFFTAFPVCPAFTARDIELFFDSAYLLNTSIETRVKLWKKWGVRAIHADCWELYTDPKRHTRFTFDYTRLIKNCHANGIAVYAWFELPYVTKDFFAAHPEWQEKTAASTPSGGTWRADFAMAMEIPACRQAVLQYVSDLLRKYDWDGVNLSELCFENVKGPEDPMQFVPMHPFVRRAFKKRFGFDPAALCYDGHHYWKTHPADWQKFCTFNAELPPGVKGSTAPTQFLLLQPFERVAFKKRYHFDPAELCYDGPRYWNTHPADWQTFCTYRAQLPQSVTKPVDPKQFVPMYPDVSAAFKKRNGFDPTALCYDGRHFWKTHPADWQRFNTYRAELLHDIYRDTLRELQHFQYSDSKIGRRAVIVTAHDTINNPEIQRNTGLDIHDVIGMMSRTGHVKRKIQGERFDFILNIEDPQNRWNDPPDRYLALGRQYQHLIPDKNRLALDINIVDLRPKKDKLRDGFATNIPLGLEALEMLHFARSVAPRVILYSESDLSILDTGDLSSPFCMLGCASASASNWKECPGGFDVNSSGMLYLRGQNEDHQVSSGWDTLLVNDYGETAIPIGKHHLQIRDDLMEEMATNLPIIHLISHTGRLEKIQSHNGRLQLKYNAFGPCLLSFDEKPTVIYLDGKSLPMPVLEGIGIWSIRCPSGHHTLLVAAQNPSLFFAQEASVISSWTIVFFGGLACLILLVLIGFTRLQRRRDAKNAKERC